LDEMSGEERVGDGRRLQLLDALCAVSIIVMLSVNLFPLWLFGQSWDASLGVLGKALFSILSGFVIAEQLLRCGAPVDFAKRRPLGSAPAARMFAVLPTQLKPISPAVLAEHPFVCANKPLRTRIKPLGHCVSRCMFSLVPSLFNRSRRA
jgi:hypothetical protein